MRHKILWNTWRANFMWVGGDKILALAKVTEELPAVSPDSPQLLLSLGPRARLWLIIPEHLHLYGAYLEALIYANGGSGPGVGRGLGPVTNSTPKHCKSWNAEQQGIVSLRFEQVKLQCAYFSSHHPQSLGPPSPLDLPSPFRLLQILPSPGGQRLSCFTFLSRMCL